jgi:uncharacterized protein YcsI (UPF0317 family)
VLIGGAVVYQLVVGAAFGLVIGFIGGQALRRVALPASGLYPIAILALIVAGYGAATLVRASGLLAVYVAALVLGNARLPHGPAIRGFAEGVAWLAQIGLFVMLGLLVSPTRLPAQILPALAVGSVLVLLARPVAVVAATLPLRLPWRHQAFLSWAGLRGAVPIVLATIPVNARVPGATRLFDIVFVVVAINTLLQGPTLPWAARWLRVIEPAEPLDVNVEAAPLEALHADLLQAEIPPGSRLDGVEIFELRLPAHANLALIVRDGEEFVPEPTTALRIGDRLLIVASAAARKQTERRLRAVSRAGKLAGWFGEYGLLTYASLDSGSMGGVTWPGDAGAAERDSRSLTPVGARARFRAGLRVPTAGYAAGFCQANLVVLDRDTAAEFEQFARRNPRPCPVLEVTVPGSPASRLAPGADLRTDLPAYRVWEYGQCVAEPSDVTGYWRDDFVAFLLGCSFTFERALLAAGVPVRHQEQGSNVPMFITNRQCQPAGRFSGPLVVSMRPVPAGLIATAVEVTARCPAAHGAPIQVGDPARLGIVDLSHPDFGDPVTPQPGDVPVFWACGVTPQVALAGAGVPLAITHSPGHMFITDIADKDLIQADGTE